jgi:esterase/lipase superfamily enzyme
MSRGESNSSAWRNARLGFAGRLSSLFLALVVLISHGCTSSKPYAVDLMPAPDLYTKAGIDPLPDEPPLDSIPWGGVLYATDRMPAGPDDELPYYLNERGYELRLGTAKVAFLEGGMSWEEAKEISLLDDRTKGFPLTLVGAEELGVLDRTASPFTDPGVLDAEPARPRREFAAMIEHKLEMSNRRDVYIYVHGYKVIFDNPMLVATELWHFLGYDGVMIAYSWPATPKRTAYFVDLETAVASGRALRALIEFLAEETSADQIHVIGYSAGTRAVLTALDQLSLARAGQSREEIRRELRLGTVALIGSDADRGLFGGMLVDGLLDLPQRLSVYISHVDSAMGLSSWVFGRERLGKAWLADPSNSRTDEFLESAENLELIDVSNVEDAKADNGHGYFRRSPWASSDLLLTLLTDRRPADRGLARDPSRPVWTFPDDYPDRLVAAVAPR